MMIQPWSRLRWVRDTWSVYRDVARDLKIEPGEWVLDIGSGAHPFPRADVLADRFTGTSHHRGGRELKSDRPLVISDVEHLPFADKSFDVVICSHVLEHVDDPETAIAELERVAQRGYIECPSASWEKVQGFPFHRWLVRNEGGTLVFEEKHGPMYDEELRSWFTEFQRQMKIESRVWLRRRELGVYTSLYWRERIARRVTRREDSRDWDPSRIVQVEATDQRSPRPGLDLFGRLVRRRAGRERATPAEAWNYVEKNLCCPACSEKLEGSPQGYICERCGNFFTLDPGGHPVLLPTSDGTNTGPEIARPPGSF
jgi:SAM-dependent methyltransferase